MSKVPFVPGWRVLLCACGLAAALVASAAEKTVRFDAQPGGKVRFEGTSTVHDWWVQSSILGGFMEIDPAAVEKPQAGSEPIKINAKAEVFIPVRSLKAKGKGPMENVMYEHLNLAAHPRINYRLVELTIPAKTQAQDPKTAQLEAKGTITVAGVTRTKSMPVTVEALGADKFKISGNIDLKMTDFGISPPNPNILGVGIKTGDEIKVSFEWLVARKQDK